MKSIEKKIPIEVSGHSAHITRIVAGGSFGKRELVAVVEFDPHVHGLISSGVHIPAKEYTRDELVKVVVRKAEKSIQRHVEKQEQEARERRDHEHMEKLAKGVSEAVGLA